VKSARSVRYREDRASSRAGRFLDSRKPAGPGRRRGRLLDASNLQCGLRHGGHAGLLSISIRDLLRATLRHRPERILVGDVPVGEAFDLFQALNTSSLGTLSTIHANSAEQALHRFTWCVLQSGVDLSNTAIRHDHRVCLHLAGVSGALRRPSAW
jgi:hypothetical protein